MSKICLGTAQFGLNYGINNPRGKIPPDEVFEILKYGLEHGIDCIDTAYDYGESEKTIGEFIKSTGKRFNIISKLPKCDGESVSQIFTESINKLGIGCLYGYLIHDFSSFSEDFTIWKELEALKAREKVRKIGFSVYFPSEIDFAINNKIVPDLIQLPYNIFDQRFSEYLPRLKELGIEIHVRSIFLQGLLLNNPDLLSGRFSVVRPKIERLNHLAKQAKETVLSILLNFACVHKCVDKVVVGVDSLAHLVEIVRAQKSSDEIPAILQQLYTFREDNEDIILPFRWQKVMVG